MRFLIQNVLYVNIHIKLYFNHTNGSYVQRLPGRLTQFLCSNILMQVYKLTLTIHIQYIGNSTAEWAIAPIQCYIPTVVTWQVWCKLLCCQEEVEDRTSLSLHC